MFSSVVGDPAAADDIVLYKVECRDGGNMESSSSELKGVFTSQWPIHQSFFALKQNIMERFRLKELSKLYYYDGYDVMLVSNDADLNVCLRFFRSCAIEYSNWRSLARLYAIVQLDRDVPKRTSCDEEVTITIASSELVHNIVLGVASALLFGTLSQSDEKLVRFAFRVCSKYGGNFVVVSPEKVFCKSCGVTLKLNKTYQMCNLTEHVLKAQCCRVYSFLGTHFLLMGCHVFKIKKEIMQITSLVADTTNSEILGLISRLSSLPLNILVILEELKNLLQESYPAVYNRCTDRMKTLKGLLQPWNSYQEIVDSSIADKIVKCSVNIDTFDEASALLFFNTLSQVLDKEHVFYQQTHAFLWECFNNGRLTNFSDKYQTLSRFQERLQFKFGKSCSYFLRGFAAAGKGKKPGSLTIREYVASHNFSLMHPNSVSRNSPSPDLKSQIYKEEVLTAIDLCCDLQVEPVKPGVTDNRVFLVNKSTDGMALKPALRYVPFVHRIVGLEDPNFFSFDDFQRVNQMSEGELIKLLKSLDFVTEAQEFRVSSIDGKVSFPVGCYYRASKGGAARIEHYDNDSRKVVQTCKHCLLNGTQCVVSCEECKEEGIVCDECEQVGHTSIMPIERKCTRCQVSKLE